MSRAEVGTASLLIADDDETIRDILCEFLGRDYDCAGASSAEEALERLGERRYNLVVSDITMPGMTGLEMVPHVLERSPDTVIVALSGAHDIETAVAAMRAGVFDFISKPFDLTQVALVVRRALEHQRLLEGKRYYEQHLQELIRRRTRELDLALDSLEVAYRTTLKALIAALETRDTDTHGHSERVVSFSLRLGHELGLDEGQMRSLEFGSLLHDIGKIGIPDAILRKPARLTAEEWKQMRQHPTMGEQILSGIEFLRGASRVVAEHHERWDGTGYPRALSGEEIDLNARIFAVADAFDAMTSNRVYRRGTSYDSAAAELELHAGCQFDPRVVEAFHRVPREDWEALRAASLLGRADALGGVAARGEAAVAGAAAEPFSRAAETPRASIGRRQQHGASRYA